MKKKENLGRKLLNLGKRLLNKYRSNYSLAIARYNTAPEYRTMAHKNYQEFLKIIKSDPTCSLTVGGRNSDLGESLQTFEKTRIGQSL